MTRWDYAIAAAVIFILLAAISGESLFTDEGYSAWLASHPGFSGMLRSLADGDSSELQMLLYNCYLWTWAHWFGTAERTLRLANLPFIVLLVTALAAGARMAFGRRLIWIVPALSPFAFTFVNQARAYTAMMACAAAAYAAMLIYIHNPRRWTPWLTAFAALAAMWFHVMGGLAIAALCVLFLLERRAFVWRDWRSPLAVAAPLLAITLGYVAWTMAHASRYVYEHPHLWEPVYTLYKFAGFASIGPANGGMVDGPGALGRYALALLVAALLLAFAVAAPVSRTAVHLAAAFGAGFALFVAFCFANGSNLSARHASALLPLVWFFVIAHVRGRWRVAALAAVWIAASIRQSGMPIYGKDDYRAAVNGAITAATHNRATLIWAADPLTASYYGLRLENPEGLATYGLPYTEAVSRVPWPVCATGVLGIGAEPPQVVRLLARGRPAVLAIPTRLPFRGWRNLSVRQPVTGDQAPWSDVIAGSPPLASYNLLGVFLLR